MSFFQWLLRWVMVAPLVLLTGCAQLHYYAQSVAGHVQMMWAARPVQDWLADPASPAPLQQQLRVAQGIRQFAVNRLHLPDNPSYQRYADIQRPYVVWNVVAAPAFSLTLKTWCFPVAGCVGYRGYFSQQQAQAMAAQLRAQGFEVSVYGVPAYSTLGWLNLFGGDPMLNTFIYYPQGEVARLLFHELAHQVLYVPDDTVFNESFATAVERLGVKAWLAEQASAQTQAQYAVIDARRAQFRALTRSTRNRLTEVYASNRAAGLDLESQMARKNLVMREFMASYQSLKASWGGYSGYDTWMAQANNAALGAQAAYDDWVSGFEALFDREGRDWPRFYDAVGQLAKRTEYERTLSLQQLTQRN